MNKLYGILYMIPCTIGENLPELVIPQLVIKAIHSLNYFVVENSKSARRFLKNINHPLPQSEISVIQIDKHSPSTDMDLHTNKLKAGESIGFISEAGMPGIADPGSFLALNAHKMGVKVKTLTGPNSILLALSGSGLNGQKFCFHGYLPKERDSRKKALQHLELKSSKNDQTQIFIETPYRNQAILKDILDVCKPTTLLCIASDLTTDNEFQITLSVKEWKNKIPDLNKKPTVFLIYAGSMNYLN